MQYNTVGSGKAKCNDFQNSQHGNAMIDDVDNDLEDMWDTESANLHLRKVVNRFTVHSHTHTLVNKILVTNFGQKCQKTHPYL